MRLKKGFSGIWIVPLVAVIDRITKALAMRLESTVPLIPGIFNARYAQNTGMAFSMLSGNNLLLAAGTVLLLAALTLWLALRPNQPRLMRAGLWLLIAGGLGNLYDRIVYGYVVDFIETAFMRFAVFNIADAAICIGAALVALSVILTERKKEQTHGRTDL